MIKRIGLLFLLGIFFNSCGVIVVRKLSSVEEGIRPLKNDDEEIIDDKISSQKQSHATSKESLKLVDDILKEAETYLGTPYKLGGSTRKGIDCSAFVVNTFSTNGISLPRTSQSQSTYGKRVKNNEIKRGDLLFFATGSNRSRITHVALVYDVTKNDIMFIHASTSKGVRIDNLSNSYWNPRFLFSNRVID